MNRIKISCPHTYTKTCTTHYLFDSHLSYAISVWGGVSEAKINPLFIAQKHCIRILFGNKEKYLEKHRTAARTRPCDLQLLGPDFFKREHTKPLFNSNGILTVHNLHSYHILLSISKNFKFHTPIALHTIFTMSRRRGTLIITSNHSESSSFDYNISILWNTFRTTPEGNEITYFNVSLSFIKNHIKNLVCKRQNLGDVNEWHPEINTCVN